MPDVLGHFGPYGGVFVPETLMPAICELKDEYERARQDPQFKLELDRLLRSFCGRPTPLYYAERLTEKLKGPRIYLKREDLLHTGAHKINNALGQILLAKRMGKTRVIAETGAGQHGVATATVAARFGFDCVIYMGKVDMERQAPNVARMEFLGAKVVPVTAGQATLKEAINEAMRDWVTNVRSTHYLLGTAYGPHPYPMLVRDFHRVIGEEARQQILEQEERLPDLLLACVGGGSNAIGLFYPFLNDAGVRMVGVEAGGRGIRPGEHAARFQAGKLGVLQGTKTWLLADEDGQIQLTHSVSAGLDYAAVGPEHSYLRDIGRVEYDFATDDAVLDAFLELSRTEGIIPALESTHAVAYLIQHAREMDRDQIVIVNMSGRGDKDVPQVAQHLALRRTERPVNAEEPRAEDGSHENAASKRVDVIEIPTEVPVMTLPNAVLFPHSLLPLHIFERRYRDMLTHSLAGDRMFSVALMKKGIEEAVEIEDLCPVAGVGLIRACVGNENGTSNLVLQGLARVRLICWTQEKPFRKAKIEIAKSVLGNPVKADALSEKVKEFCVRIEKIGVPLPPNLMDHLKQIDSPEILSDVVAASFVGEAFQRQQLLEAYEVCERLRLLIQFLRSQSGGN